MIIAENCSLFGSTDGTISYADENTPPVPEIVHADAVRTDVTVSRTDECTPRNVVHAQPSVTVSRTDESSLLVEDSPETAVSSGETPSLMTCGVSRKRSRTKSAKLQQDYEEHPLLPGCGSSCKKKCSSKSVDRLCVHDKFWEMGCDDRKAWIAAHVKLSRVNRRRVETSVRNCTRIYTLPAQDFGDVVVCKKFFLTTLGLTCDKVVTTAVSCENVVRVAGDKRGQHEPASKFSSGVVEDIKSHIESYHPSISHYRREHAPFRRYISPEISIREMHEDFLSCKHNSHSSSPSLTKCSYEFYRRTVKSMNISFVKLGEEECELCLQHDAHKKECNAEECDLCSSWDMHMESARVSRMHYKNDCEKVAADEAFLSCDMQKIIMLPRMPGIKTCMFTRRLVAFHETFAPLGGRERTSQAQPVGIVWHEGIAGRNADDVMSCFSKTMKHEAYRDIKKVTFYADNCGAQNKNWILTMKIHLI